MIEPTLTDRVIAVEYMTSLMMRAVGNLSPEQNVRLAIALETLAEVERETRPGVTTLLVEKATMLRARARDRECTRATCGADGT
ncbi:hypothetical protein RISW2_20655 [Roseivivax isoporae LMG 25204]|uniref:Uncharacterized protein n=2 Tax=Roseivivax TaxID=93682 RepID=X7F3Q7_9RHOB|nr:hypothetical protein RISW2_20655 [Roseivivax isoporae LMG 25204]